MSLFKKPNRKFKQRSARIDSDEEDKVVKLDQQEENVINLESADEIKRESISIKNKLSFEDDDDQIEFELKKSKSSLRALRQLERKRKEAKKMSKHIESTNQTKSIRKMMETNKESLDERSLTDQQNHVINLDYEIDLDEKNSDQNDIDYLRIYAEYKKPSAKSSQIPDNKTIELLKRQRYLAKEQESLDFLPLNSKNEENDYMNESSTSRLVREDPNDKEAICIDDDEDNADLDDDRVNFYTDKTNLQKERIKEAFFSVQNEQVNNESDTDDEWEKAQIKKGVGLPQQCDFRTDDFANYLMTNQRSQTNPYDPPSYIAKLNRSVLSKDKLLEKYKDEFEVVISKLDTLYNQLNNIELTIRNIKESLQDRGD